MSKGRFNFAPPESKVSLGWLIQSGEAENSLFNPITLNLFPPIKASKKCFPIPVRYNPELRLADQWEYDS